MTTTFDETPLIAPYLLGFVVADLEFTSNELTKRPGDPLIRIAVSFIFLLNIVLSLIFNSFINLKFQTRPNTNKTTKHAVDINEKVLREFEDYLNFQYELPKLDSVAITGTDGRELSFKRKVIRL